MKRVTFFTAAFVATCLAVIPVFAAEANFDRTLKVNGKADLSVSTGAGSIRITHGADGQIHVSGRVRSSFGGSDEQVRQLADNPPIEQTGNIVRIGVRRENMHNISIDYEIQAPVDCFLKASSGSGEINVEGVGDNAKLNTGSGSIHASGLRGGFSIETGSGNIYADQIGDGEVKAETGSGSIELRNLHGALVAQTGSGEIKAAGTPSAPWKLETGSGSIEVSTGAAGINIDAGTGSGSIHTDREMTTQGTANRHHVTGKINGGGPVVKLDTGSGSIRIH
jgi:DUF4097 and DUF4098 domain-containing protein YvlB